MSAARSLLQTPYAPTQPELVNTGVMGTVYVVHFVEPLAHARHYIGWTQDLAKRMGQHRAGYGGRLMAAVTTAGIGWRVVHTEPGDRNRERQLKNRSSAARRLCWVCEVEGRAVAGSVPFALGRTRAHVMRHQDSGEPYRSICGYRVLRYWQAIRWTSHDERPLPWCSWCSGRVKELAAAVLGDQP